MRFAISAASTVTLLVGLVLSCAPFGGEPSVAQDDAGGPSSNDAGESDAGESDAGELDGAALTASFCADAGTAFCDDFERGEVLGAWTRSNVSGGSTLEIDGTLAASPSRSLRVFLPKGKASKHHLLRTTETAARRFTLAFSMRFAEIPSATVQLAAIDFEGRNRVYLVWNSNQQQLRLIEQDYPEDGGNNDVTYSAGVGKPPAGTFVRYELRVDLDTKVATVETDVPGLTGTLKMQIPHEQPRSISIGNYATTAPASDTTIWFDDVVIR